MLGLAETILGIGLLLGGIFTIRSGLKHLLLNKLKPLLRLATDTPLRGILVGTVTAALFQSSTAVSLITIGFVSAEYISFRNALGIILGANIGTCSTVQLMTFSLPTDYLLPVLGICILLSFVRATRYLALTLAGFGSIFTGLYLLSNGLGTLSDVNSFQYILSLATANPLYALLAGIIGTFLFQSSSAATAVLMALADKGLIDLVTSAYVVYGNNIGSCLSSVMVGTVAPLAAKRVAAAHILLNILGVALFFPLTKVLTSFTIWVTSDFAAQVALIHTLFNILSSLLVLPFIRQFAYLVELLVPGKR